MAIELVTAKSSKFTLVCIAPDVCKTQVGSAIVPIPYPITHKMNKSDQCSKNVFVNKKPVFLHGLSFVDKVLGDQPGTRGGIITNVNGKVSHSKMHCKNVFVNGKPLVRTGDMVFMNTKKP